MNMYKLTPEQKQFAEENHALVFGFLQSNHLNENDFYDIVIFGFLNAVKKYFENDKLKRKYAFSTIAWNTMLCSLSNYYTAQNRQKRQAYTLSLDTPFIQETAEKTNSLMIELETELLLNTIAAAVSDQQMQIIRMKKDGYAISEIARNRQLSRKNVQKLLTETKNIIEAICYC